ncbi:MAG: hypothetical protein QF903_10540 [Planctomycetota bacterium]|jgi:hypothetical protein|nr:hypothetical protein [Planctomycetota bacterium]MDP6762995.1 hypothetical protein [Planctomycetota bacterium]MDP6989905.1 hypothetical protein [Planctomycetota bacterium]
MRTACLRLAVAAALLVAVDQGLLHTLAADDRLGDERLAPFDPPLFSDWQREQLGRYRAQQAAIEAGSVRPHQTMLDPELGWVPDPHRTHPDYRYDWSGARVGVAPLARERREGVRRVVAVGCSFTHGDEVSGGQTWAARVDEARKDLEVANLGCGGYGLDQALLRLRRDGLPLGPDEVWFGWLPAATGRVTTVFPPLLHHQARTILFKPRFHLDGAGRLVAVPNPAPSLAANLAALSSQEAFLAAVGEDDLRLARTPAAYAPRGSHWLHRSFVGRVLLTRRAQSRRASSDWLADPQSEVYRLYRALVLAMAEEARAAGARFRLWVLPAVSHPHRSRLETGGLYWSHLANDLAAAGVETHDVTAVLEAAGGHANPSLWRPAGHYSAEGNALVAGEMLRVLALDG